MSKFADFKERKLDRLRAGQATMEKIELPSDPETAFALVPLTEAEYRNTLTVADQVMAGDNPAGAAVRDEVQRQQLVFHSARTLNDLTVKFFDDAAEVGELDAHDINFIYDIYLEMVAQASPTLMGLSEEDFEGLKKALPRIEWSALSGRQWYAAQRFLNSIRPLLLTGSSSGSFSTRKPMLMNDEQDSALNVISEK